MASQLSGDLPNVWDRRKAISSVTLLFPFSKRVNVDAGFFSGPEICYAGANLSESRLLLTRVANHRNFGKICP